MGQRFSKVLNGGQNARPNFDFWLLLTALIVINIPYLQPQVLLTHDTYAIYQFFHVIYNGLFYNNALPQWFPYENYGLTSLVLQLSFLSPLSYVCMLIGWVFHATDILLLFKLSVIAEQVFFLIGMYLLSATLFRSRFAVIFVCLAGILSTVWNVQITLNFRMYCALPLLIYFGYRAFSERDGRFLLALALTAVVFATNAVYFNIVYLYGFLAVCAAGFWVGGRIRFRGRVSARSWVVLGCVVVFYACMVWLLASTGSTETIVAPYRDQGGGTSLKDFLNYTKAGFSISSVLQHFLSGGMAFLPIGGMCDVTVYIGILPVIFFVWAIWRVRRVSFVLLLVAILGLAAFSTGELVAGMAYHLPMMKYVRHINYIWSVIKILILIAAGYGLDDLWQKGGQRAALTLVLVLLSLLVCVDLVVADSRRVFFSGAEAVANGVVSRIVCGGGVLALILLLRRLKAILKWPGLFNRQIGAVLLISFLFWDMGNFRTVVFDKTSPVRALSEDQRLRLFHVSPLAFRETRLKKADRVYERDLSTFKELKKLAYNFSFQYLQIDPCWPKRRSNLINRGVREIITKSKAPKGALEVVMGCGYPKLRLFTRAVFIKDQQEAVRLVKEKPAEWFEDQVMIERGSKKENVPDNAGNGSPAAGRVGVSEFSNDRVVLEVEVENEGGAWLYYADAFHPGWQARVDGKRQAIYRANGVFKAVALSRGRHTVQLEFFYPGTIVSYMQFLLGIVAGVIVAITAFRMLLGKPLFWPNFIETPRR